MKANKVSLIVLAITAIACSRAVFAFIHDPEGPNLLIVFGLAAIIFVITAGAYLSNLFPSATGAKRALIVILLQIAIAAGLCFSLR
jgi:MFS family permease